MSAQADFDALIFELIDAQKLILLQYSPILNILAVDFHVSNERASLVPTLAQAGYAVGKFWEASISTVIASPSRGCLP